MPYIICNEATMEFIVCDEKDSAEEVIDGILEDGDDRADIAIYLGPELDWDRKCNIILPHTKKEE